MASYNPHTSQSLGPYLPLSDSRTILEPHLQNQILTQPWYWLPQMRCSILGDSYPGTVYIILEIVWNGNSKVFHLQKVSGGRGEAYRDAMEVELRGPDDEVGIGAQSLVKGDVRGGLRKEEIGRAGRALGIGSGDQYVHGHGGDITRSLGGSVCTEQMHQPHGGLSYSGSGYQSAHMGYPSSYVIGQGPAVGGFDSGYSGDDRDHSRGGSDRRQWRDDRDDRDDSRGRRGKEGGGKKSHGREKDRDGKDRGRDKKDKSSGERERRS